jgi:hypothetical protein
MVEGGSRRRPTKGYWARLEARPALKRECWLPMIRSPFQPEKRDLLLRVRKAK